MSRYHIKRIPRIPRINSGRAPQFLENAKRKRHRNKGGILRTIAIIGAICSANKRRKERKLRRTKWFGKRKA